MNVIIYLPRLFCSYPSSGMKLELKECKEENEQLRLEKDLAQAEVKKLKERSISMIAGNNQVIRIFMFSFSMFFLSSLIFPPQNSLSFQVGKYAIKVFNSFLSSAPVHARLATS